MHTPHTFAFLFEAEFSRPRRALFRAIEKGLSGHTHALVAVTIPLRCPTGVACTLDGTVVISTSDLVKNKTVRAAAVDGRIRLSARARLRGVCADLRGDRRAADG